MSLASRRRPRRVFLRTAAVFSFAAVFGLVLLAGCARRSAPAQLTPPNLPLDATVRPSVGQYNGALFSGMRWRELGPFRAGRCVAVAGSPQEPHVFYFGAVDGGVWRTIDDGTTWQPIFDQEPVASIGALAVAPSDPNVIYVGTGEADVRSEIDFGDGMYKSTDGGRTWTHIGLADAGAIARIVVDPSDANRVLVAVLGKVYAANAERGVFRSTNGGQTWHKVLYKNPNVGAIDLAIDPRNANTLYAALWATRRPPWNVYPPSNEPGSGLFKSINGGASWTQLTQGLPADGLGRIGVAVAPSEPSRVYAIVDAREGGLYRSDNAGASWRRMDADPRIWGRGWYFGGIAVDPQNPDKLYLMDVSTYRSTDGGASFEAIKGSPIGDDYHQLWINPTDPNRMVLGSDQGTIVSVDGARSWSSWNNQPTGQFYHITADNQIPFHVWGAMQDSGARGVAIRSYSGALNFHEWENACTGGESGSIAADPLSVAELYGSTVTRCNQVTHASQNISPLLAYPGMAFRHTWTLPVVFSMADKRDVYFANQYLFRSADGGHSWQMISPDLTRPDPGIPLNLDPTTATDLTYQEQHDGPRWGVIYTIAPSPLRANEIWIGTDDGYIQITQNAGQTWQNVTPPALTAWSKVIMMEASHSDPNTAYAAIDRHRLNDFKPHIYRTRNGGKTWQEIVQGIPAGAFLQAIKEDPQHPGLLFAGTELGVYVSFNDGDQWQPLQLNLPPVDVRDFVIKDATLVAATFGRSLWALDDITPLRQINASVAGADAYLYAPEPATRMRSGFGLGTSPATAPDRDPVEASGGANPPSGAIIDYYLKTDASGPVTLEILDSAGRLVRRYASTDRFPRSDPNTMEMPAVWAATPQPLLATAGMHRVSWDLDWTPLAGGGGGRGFFRRGALMALPGQYTVRLTVGGRSYSQPLTVQEDPRIHAPLADLEAQFNLAQQINAARARNAAARTAAARLLRRLADLEKHAAGSGDVATAAAALERKLAALVGIVPPPSPDSSGEGAATPPADSLDGLAGALGLEAAAVESTDAAPSAEAITGFQKSQQTLTAALSQWIDIQAKDLAQLNMLLRQNHSPALVLGTGPGSGSTPTAN